MIPLIRTLIITNVPEQRRSNAKHVRSHQLLIISIPIFLDAQFVGIVEGAEARFKKCFRPRE